MFMIPFSDRQNGREREKIAHVNLMGEGESELLKRQEWRNVRIKG